MRLQRSVLAPDVADGKRSINEKIIICCNRRPAVSAQQRDVVIALGVQVVPGPRACRRARRWGFLGDAAVGVAGDGERLAAAGAASLLAGEFIADLQQLAAAA